jgi:serine/threonine-protein kinase
MAPLASPPKVVAGRYLVHGEIGRGGCASVYDGVDAKLGRPVAIKIARPNAADTLAGARLAREARAAGAISHPNVCAVSDAGTLDDGRNYLVMERLHGETLTSCLIRTGALQAEDAIDIALQLLSALDAAHAIGIVHRDVKPDNVFLVPRAGCAPAVKLLDFGLCCINSPRLADDVNLTHAGQVVGTPEYMAPEQVTGSRAFDARIDVYAVGVILYEMLTGSRAFTGKDVRAVVMAVLAKPPPPLRVQRPDLPPVLDRIIDRAMHRERTFRYRSAAELQNDLLEAKATITRRVSHHELVPYQSDEYDAFEDELYPEAFEHAGADWDAPTITLRPSSRSARQKRPA